MTTLHMKTSTGRIPSSGTLPLPVVWYSPSAERSWSSEMASGWSILFPRMTKGVFFNSSIARRASSSALDSERRSWSLASTRKTIPETSGTRGVSVVCKEIEEHNWLTVIAPESSSLCVASKVEGCELDVSYRELLGGGVEGRLARTDVS